MRLIAVALILAVLQPSSAAAMECLATGFTSEEVVVTTVDGKRLKGMLMCVDAEKVVIDLPHRTRTVPRSAIDTIVTARDPVWNGFAIGAAVGALILLFGSYEAHLREDSVVETVGPILGLGALGAAIDAAQHSGGRRVTLPDRRIRVAWSVRF